MIAATSWLSLMLLTIAVSQPLFYGLALGRATRQLSAAAYVELRQQINLAITQRLVRLYVATLMSLLALLALAWGERAWTLAAGSAIAVASLIGDGVLASKLNVPINTQMDGWNLAALPADWQAHRARWDSALATRRIVLLTGFAAFALALLAHR